MRLLRGSHLRRSQARQRGHGPYNWGKAISAAPHRFLFYSQDGRPVHGGATARKDTRDGRRRIRRARRLPGVPSCPSASIGEGRRRRSWSASARTSDLSIECIIVGTPQARRSPDLSDLRATPRSRPLGLRRRRLEPAAGRRRSRPSPIPQAGLDFALPIVYESILRRQPGRRAGGRELLGRVDIELSRTQTKKTDHGKPENTPPRRTSATRHQQHRQQPCMRSGRPGGSRHRSGNSPRLRCGRSAPAPPRPPPRHPRRDSSVDARPAGSQLRRLRDASTCSPGAEFRLRSSGYSRRGLRRAPPEADERRCRRGQ